MGRLFFIITIVVLIYWIFTLSRRKAPRQEKTAQPLDMVACVACGVNLPVNESFLVGGKYYCSVEHSRTPAGK